MKKETRPTITQTDDQLRVVLGGLLQPAEKACKIALDKMTAAHKAGQCNAIEVRREIGNIMLPHVLKINSGIAAETVSMLIANNIVANAHSQLGANMALDGLRDILEKLSGNQKPPRLRVMSGKTKSKTVKKYSLKLVDKVCKPTHWIAHHLSRLIPHNPRKSQLIIGMVLLTAGCVLEGISEHLWLKVAVCEPLKAVGAAPVCRMILDFLSWEA